MPGAWREGDVVLLAGASPVALAGSEYQARFGEARRQAGTPRPRRRGGADRVPPAAAPRCSLVHDVSLGGLAVALAKAALHSGIGAERDAAGRPARAVRRRRRPGGARLRRPATSTGSAASRSAGSASSAATRCSASPLADLQEACTRLMCGVFGIRSAERDVARLTYFGLLALQHRGQESAGIAVSDRGRLTVLRDMGLVTQVFDEEKLHGAPGRRRDRAHALLDDRLDALGERAAARPSRAASRTVALGHNGNLTNTTELRDGARRRRDRAGADLRHRGDRGADRERPGAARGGGRAARCRGSRAPTRSSRCPRGSCVAFRDPHGFRPLALGRLGDDWVVASETCALRPGRRRLRARGRARRARRDRRGGPRTRPRLSRSARQALCIFEFFYLARPDSTLDGVEVHGVARAHGRAARRRRRRSRPTS